jgi:hypothetical protein
MARWIRGTIVRRQFFPNGVRPDQRCHRTSIGTQADTKRPAALGAAGQVLASDVGRQPSTALIESTVTDTISSASARVRQSGGA